VTPTETPTPRVFPLQNTSIPALDPRGLTALAIALGFAGYVLTRYLHGRQP
jgi:hypothetical protein